MEKYNLYLDDVRIPERSYKETDHEIYASKKWVIVRNYNEFVDYITKHGIPESISFDHDLGKEHYKHQGVRLDYMYDTFKEKTGFHCAKWLINYCIDNNLESPKLIYIHSMSTEGAKNIKSLFNTYYKVYNITGRNVINDVMYDFNINMFIYTYYD